MNEERNRDWGFPARRSVGHNALWIACFALLYFGTARLSLSFLFQPEGFASIWPAGGIFLSAILLTRRDLRPWLVAVLFLTDLVAQTLAGTVWWVSALYALILAGDAVLSAALLLRFVGEPIRFGRVREVVGFLTLAVILSNALWSLAAVAASRFFPTTTFATFWTWWAVSDGVGNLLVTPFLLSWAALASTGLGRWNRQRAIEAAALFLPLALLNYAAFAYLSQPVVFSLLHAYITFPFLLWAALRFGIRGVSSALLILAAIALVFVAAGRETALSPVFSHGNAIMLAQLYLALLAAPSLLLAAVMTERRQGYIDLRAEIAERHRAEEAQREALLLLREVLDTVPVRVFWKDRASRFLGCNSPFAKDAGLGSPEEIIGKSDFDMSWRDQADTYRADDLSVMETGIPKIGYEEPQTTPAGDRSWLRTSKIPLKDAAGNIIGTLGTYEDITERKRAEMVLREREYLLSETQRMAHIGSWRWDLSGPIEWTDETYRIYGVSPETFTPTRESLVSLLHPEDRSAMQRWIEACAAGQSPGDLEFRAILPNGSLRLLSGRGELKYDADKRPAFLAGTVQDITERKQAEELLQSQAKLLEKLVHERTAELEENVNELEALSYSIAHDLRAPLRSILGYIHLLQSPPQDLRSQAGTEYLGRITDAARRMDRLIQDVLALSRITRTQVALEPVDVGKVLQGVLDSYPALQPAHVHIQVQSPLPTVMANEAALTQCLSNVLGNAVKFATPGLTSRVDIWAEQLTVSGRDGGAGPALPFVRLWFADNGIGIAPDHQERIFDIFQRVDKSFEGTGIGLAIVRKAMQRMGGKVGLESEPGKGSRFWLEFSQPGKEKEQWIK